MRRNKLLFIIFVCVFAMHATLLEAQDPHFSQYFASPMTLNPALVGKGVGDWRAIALFRSQWWGGSVAPYSTRSASIEKSYRTSSSNDNNAFGAGLSVLSDVSNSGLLQNNYISASGSYNIALNKQANQILAVGLQGTYANKRIDASKFQFQSQFGSMGFQRTASGDPVSVTSNSYLEANMGIHFSKTDSLFGYGIGAAIYHASSPKEGIYNNVTYIISPRYSFQANMNFTLKSKDEIHFSSVLDLQGNNSIFTLGGLYKISINDNKIKSINIGLWNRFNDALYPYFGIESKNVIFGLSYDIVNPSLNSNSSYAQSLEASVSWLFGSKRSPNRPETVIRY